MNTLSTINNISFNKVYEPPGPAYSQTGGIVATNGSAVKITYNATNATGTGLTQSVGTFTILKRSKISGLRILLVSGGGGGGEWGSKRLVRIWWRWRTRPKSSV